jgi:hypothetical protein
MHFSTKEDLLHFFSVFKLKENDNRFYLILAILEWEIYVC